MTQNKTTEFLNELQKQGELSKQNKINTEEIPPQQGMSCQQLIMKELSAEEWDILVDRVEDIYTEECMSERGRVRSKQEILISEFEKMMQ